MYFNFPLDYIWMIILKDKKKRKGKRGEWKEGKRNRRKVIFVCLGGRREGKGKDMRIFMSNLLNFEKINVLKNHLFNPSKFFAFKSLSFYFVIQTRDFSLFKILQLLFSPFPSIQTSYSYNINGFIIFFYLWHNIHLSHFLTNGWSNSESFSFRL